MVRRGGRPPPSAPPRPNPSTTNSSVTGPTRSDVDPQQVKLNGNKNKPPDKIPETPVPSPSPPVPAPPKKSLLSKAGGAAGTALDILPAALGAGAALGGLYALGPGGLLNDAATSFTNGAENAIGGLTSGIGDIFEGIGDVGGGIFDGFGSLGNTLGEGARSAGGLFTNATYLVIATGMIGTFIYVYRMPK